MSYYYYLNTNEEKSTKILEVKSKEIGLFCKGETLELSKEKRIEINFDIKS